MRRPLGRRHLPPGLPLCLVLRVGGAYRALPFLVLGAVLAVLARDGRIETVGPLQLMPAMPGLASVPFVLALAVPLGYVRAGTSPVRARRGRGASARVAAHLCVLGAGAAVLAFGLALSTSPPVSASLRNLLALAGLALMSDALLGTSLAWLFPLVVFTAALYLPSEHAWSLPAFLFAGSAPLVHLVLAAAVLALGLLLAALDPLRREDQPGC